MSINSQILATMEGEGILNEGALPLPDQTFAPSLAVNSGDVIREGQETPLTDSMKQKLLNSIGNFILITIWDCRN